MPFLLDDYGKIIRNPDIKSLSNITSRLIYPYGSTPEFHRNDPSRPLTYLTLTLNYHFNQLDPAGYHIVNIALHVIVVSLVFVLASSLLPMIGIPGVAFPFLSALLFGVHPINVNAVTYVMGGRPSELSALCYLLAVILFIYARQAGLWRMIASAFCFFLALASNQLAITLPAIIFIVDLCFFSEGNLQRVLHNWKQHVLYWGILGLYIGWRIAYFGQLGDVEATAQFFSRSQYFLTEWVVIWKYIGLVLWPKGLSFEHLFGPINQFTDISVIATLVLYVILIAVLIKGSKLWWQQTRFVLFGFLWFIITLAPTSSFFPTTATMAENRMYIPAIGLCLIIPFIGYRQKAIFSTLAGVFALGLASITYQRNILYQDPSRIWLDIIRKYPNHERAHKNLALEYYKQGRTKEMVEETREALRIAPTDLDARTNLAQGYYILGQYEDALNEYRIIVKENPKYAVAYSNMGLIYEALHDARSAIVAYQKSIELDPRLIEPLNNLGGIYYQNGQREEAARWFKKALEIDPHNPQILKNLSLATQ